MAVAVAVAAAVAVVLAVGVWVGVDVGNGVSVGGTVSSIVASVVGFRTLTAVGSIFVGMATIATRPGPVDEKPGRTGVTCMACSSSTASFIILASSRPNCQTPPSSA
jgi:hypothetical protein